MKAVSTTPARARPTDATAVNPLLQTLEQGLEARARQQLYRRRRVTDSPQQPWLSQDGRNLLAFSSNDYLGLANHPQVVEAFIAAARQYGVGSGASHLINGHLRPHHQLEEALADFTARERAVLFSTGYQANLGTLSALLGRHDRLFEDRLNHASLIDGATLSRARLLRYRHADSDHLGQLLAQNGSGTALIATDGVFSMDGDLAPLPQLASLACDHGAWLMVDDAHGIGVLGQQGGGILEHFGLGQEQVPILMGTLGKALGTFGAFVAGAAPLIETLINSARPYIYTTALPPAVAAASCVSLELLRRETWRREHLQQLIARLRAGAASLGLPLMASDTPIQPLLLGSSATALAWSQALEAQGILITAIRPPTVPQGSARLRITLSASHDAQQIDQLLDALARVKQQLGAPVVAGE